MPNPESSPEHLPAGVLAHRLEGHEYVVSIRWKDGQQSEMHLPVNGFDVLEPETRQRLGKLTGEEALQILVHHAAKTTREEFDWRNFLEDREKG